MLTKCSKDFLVSNMKKIGFNGHIYGLSVDYDAINVDDILDITSIWWEKMTVQDVWVY